MGKGGASRASRAPRIGFVQPHAFGLLFPGSRAPFGGAEVRAFTFARMLKAAGTFHPVFEVGAERLPPKGPLPAAEFEIFPGPEREFTLAKPDGDTLRAFERARLDALVSLGANEVSHEMTRLGEALGLPTVVGIASDQSLGRAIYQNSATPNEYGVPGFHVWEALQRADLVLAQTRWQQDHLRRLTTRASHLVPNPIPAGWEDLPAGRASAFEFDFLWVGRPGPDKNPDLVFEMARELPRATFRMVVDGGLAALPEWWRRHLPPNVVLSDRVDGQAGIQGLMRACRAILNTSPLEGFPNLMLQGAMVGCPTFFLAVDPDGWASEHGCAASAFGDIDALAPLLATALTDEPRLKDMAERARQRAETFHAPAAVQRSWTGALGDLLRETGSVGA